MRENYRFRFSDFAVKTGIDRYEKRNLEDIKRGNNFSVESRATLLSFYNVAVYLGACVAFAKGIELLLQGK
jgi:hypothetical protein